MPAATGRFPHLDQYRLDPAGRPAPTRAPTPCPTADRAKWRDPRAMPDAEPVTDPRPLRKWNPLRPLNVVAHTGVAAAYQTLFFTMRRLMLGRRLTVRVEGGDLTLTITRFHSPLRVRSSVFGHLDYVRLMARDVRWDGHRLDRVSVILHDVHVRATVPPVLVAAPVELTVEVPTPVLDDLLRWAAPRLSGDVGPDGVARLWLAKRRGTGHVEVEARLDGSTMLVKPVAVVRRKRWTLPARTPSYPVRLPELPHGLSLTSVQFAPGVVRLTGTLPHWRMDMPRTRLEDVIGPRHYSLGRG